MSNLDDTRKKIGIDSLSKEDREKLFKEFVKSGGKVLSERELMRQKIKEQLAKQKSIKTPTGSPQPKSQIQTKSQTQPKLQQVSQKKKEEKKDILNITLLDRIKVFLNAYFQNTIKLSGYLKTKFFEKTIKEVPTAFNDLRIIAYLLTQKDPKLTTNVKKSLNAISPIGYEIVYRFNELPNQEIFEKIERIYKLFLQTRETSKPEHIKEIIKYIFKKLYLIYPYKDQTKVIVSTALRSVSQYIPKNDFQKMEKLFYKIWEFLFEEYFQQIKSVIDLLIGKEISLSSEHLIKFLEINETDYIGYLTEKMQISKIEEEKPKEEKQQKEQPKEIPITPAEEGIRIINSINLRKIQESIRKKDTYLEYNDKIFITEAIIEFYEKHIYPVLVLKTKYSIIFDPVKTIDIKKTFDDIYTNIRNLRDRINEYYKVVSDIKTIESDVMIPINQKSGLLNSRNAEKTKMSYQIRKEITEVFGRIKNNIEIVISDYRSGGNILLNPQEYIEFKVDKIKDIETEKNFFEGEKVIDALEKIHKIIEGIIFLFTDGDLGGSNTKIEKSIYLQI